MQCSTAHLYFSKPDARLLLLFAASAEKAACRTTAIAKATLASGGLTLATEVGSESLILPKRSIACTLVMSADPVLLLGVALAQSMRTCS